METLRFLWKLLTRRKHGLITFLISIITGVLSGVCTTGLIATVHQLIKRDADAVVLADFWHFMLLLAGHAVFGILSTGAVAKLLYNILFDLRVELSHRLLMTPLHTTERIGTARLIGLFTHVIDTIAHVVESMPGHVKRAAMLVGIYAYLAWLALPLFLIFALFLGLGLIVYILPMKAYQRYQSRKLQAHDMHLKHIHALVEGLKELLQNRFKSTAMLDQYIRPSGEYLKDISIRTVLFDSSLGRWGEVYALLGLAMLLFFLPEWGLATHQEVGDFLLIVLFSLAPMTSLISFMFNLQTLKSAFQKLDLVGLQLEDETSTDSNKQVIPALSADASLTLNINALTYTYRNEEQTEEYTLGPVSFSAEAPEIIFITGGNGSGKSTLAKILCGLYIPETGDLSINDQPVRDHNRAAYKQFFSVIFFDFFLFDTLLSLEDGERDAAANTLLVRLNLAHKVRVHNGAFTTNQLSQGQRKRLALLTSYLEDRPICIFDEWAADQDAAFKTIFYEEIIPELKSQGKMVFVISHDESFFHIADQVIKLVDGKQTVVLPAKTSI